MSQESKVREVLAAVLGPGYMVITKSKGGATVALAFREAEDGPEFHQLTCDTEELLREALRFVEAHKKKSAPS
jgi:hypothetical protein